MKRKGLWLPIILCLIVWSFAITGCNKDRTPAEPEIATDITFTDDVSLYASMECESVELTSLTIGTDEEILRIEYHTGDIYYHGQLITKDKELADAFRNMFEGYTCPHCGRNMYEEEAIHGN